MSREKVKVYIYTRVSTSMQDFGVNLIYFEDFYDKMDESERREFMVF